MENTVCPECGGRDVRPSSHLRFNDVFHRILGQQAWRCRTCRVRFYKAALTAAVPETTPKEHKHKHRSRRSFFERNRKRLIQAAIVAVMVVAFLAFLRYITQEHGGGEAEVSMLMGGG